MKRSQGITFVLAVSLIATVPCFGNGADLSADSTGTPEVTHLEQVGDAYQPRPALPRPARPARPVLRGLHQSVQVNVDALGFNILGDAANEPSLAIDPTDPDNLVIGWRQFNTVHSNFRQAGYAYSDDAGRSWTYPGVLEPGQFRSDPVLAADSRGNFYYYSLSRLDAAEMFVSVDGGRNWSGPIPAFGGDKTWMTIDTTGGRGDGNLYALWNSQFTCCGHGTDFTRSIDGGFSYEGPFVMPEKPKWGTLDVGLDGELYVVGTRITYYSYPSPHLILRSSNAADVGQTPLFERTGPIDLGGETAFGGTPNPGGLLGQVGVAVDRSSGRTRGNVYVLGSVDPPGPDPLDVMFVRSTDGGLTWSEPIRVHDDRDAAWQWFGTMSAAPDGRIDVVWNDTRNFPDGRTSETFYAYSVDAGRSWSRGLAVSPPWDSLVGHPRQNKIGDYYQMISDERGAALAYSTTFNGEQDVWFLRVGDCNANGRHDSADLAFGSSGDCNADGIPDECLDITPCLACSAADDCDDGLVCNGAERCIDNECRPGLPLICDDGNPLTEDQCKEPLGCVVRE